MIDCHAHLASPAFEADLAAVLLRAEQVGVSRILVVGEDLADDLRVVELCRKHVGRLFACVGLHPDRFAEDRELPTADSIAAVGALARAHRDELVAIGEVGLDYHWVKSEPRRAAQRACLEAMVALASELSLPLNVHTRSAGHHAIDLLADVGAKRVLLHAFDGKGSYAKRAFDDHGYFFSIPPSVVRSEQKQKLVRSLPLEALALESDSPVLGPAPRERNEPANIPLAVECIAKLQGTTVERVLETTESNAGALFFAT